MAGGLPAGRGESVKGRLELVFSVVPARAGTTTLARSLGSRFRGNDDQKHPVKIADGTVPGKSTDTRRS